MVKHEPIFVNELGTKFWHCNSVNNYLVAAGRSDIYHCFVSETTDLEISYILVRIEDDQPVYAHKDAIYVCSKIDSLSENEETC